MSATTYPRVSALAWQVMWALEAADNIKDVDWMPDSADTLIIKTNDGARFTLLVQPLNHIATIIHPAGGPTIVNGDRVIILKQSSQHYGHEGDVVREPNSRNGTYLVQVDDGTLRSYYIYDIERKELDDVESPVSP